MAGCRALTLRWAGKLALWKLYSWYYLCPPPVKSRTTGPQYSLSPARSTPASASAPPGTCHGLFLTFKTVSW